MHIFCYSGEFARVAISSVAHLHPQKDGRDVEKYVAYNNQKERLRFFNVRSTTSN